MEEAMAEGGLDVARLAASYRRLVLWFGAQLALGILGAVAVAVAGPNALGVTIAVVRLVGILATVCALGIYSYRTAAALGSRVGLLWGLAMLVPLVNAITLLVLSSKATKACRAAGVPVGFLGPKFTESPSDGDSTGPAV
jgi:hypothetical protein